MTHTKTQTLGRWGEDRAATYLEEQGYTILFRNVRTSYGEIDLIAQQENSNDDSPELIFIEVKTRASNSLGPPEVSVNDRKQAHMRASALAFLQEHPEYDCPWRIDVVAIKRFPSDVTPEIIHFQNAIH